MIFDLLTIRDLYNRIQLYPLSNGLIPFPENNNITDIRYEIDEGYYFELKYNYTSQNATQFCEMNIKNILPNQNADKSIFVHAIKIEYRCKKDVILIGTFLLGSNANIKLQASEQLTSAVFVINRQVYGHDTFRFYSNYPGLQEPGDYLIIKKVEILNNKT